MFLLFTFLFDQDLTKNCQIDDDLPNNAAESKEKNIAN